MGIRVNFWRSFEVLQSWSRVGFHTFRAILRIRWRSSLVYFETWKGAKLGPGFQRPADLLRATGEARNSLSPLWELGLERPDTTTETWSLQERSRLFGVNKYKNLKWLSKRADWHIGFRYFKKVKRCNVTGDIPKRCTTWLDVCFSIDDHLTFRYDKLLWCMKTFS